MTKNPGLSEELVEARALIKATAVALDRFGFEMSYEQLKEISDQLVKANDLLKAAESDTSPRHLMAAMMAIDQVRQFLVQQKPH